MGRCMQRTFMLFAVLTITGAVLVAMFATLRQPQAGPVYEFVTVAADGR